MLRLRFRQYKTIAAASIEDTGKGRSLIVAHQIQRRWCLALVVVASVSTMFALSLGFATVGVAIAVAAILPFAFVS